MSDACRWDAAASQLDSDGGLAPPISKPLIYAIAVDRTTDYDTQDWPRLADVVTSHAFLRLCLTVSECRFRSILTSSKKGRPLAYVSYTSLTW